MKKCIILCVAMLLCQLINAQLTVQSNGNVSMAKGVAIGDAVPDDSVGVIINHLSSSATGRDFGVYSVNLFPPMPIAQSGCHVGVLGKTASTSLPSPGWRGETDSITKSQNIISYPFKAGVVGLSSAGCAIYGSTSATIPNTWTYGNFAGFFNGNARVTGTMYASSFNTTSDSRLKENITGIDCSVANAILSLHPVSYRFIASPMIYLDGNEKNRTHYGLVAQEVRDILPNIVSEDSEGYLSINYIELIPLLIQTIKQQQTQIEELQSKLYELTNNTKRNLPARQTDRPQLKQNTPNPFSQNTKIDYYLPTDTREAAIRVHDMSGAEIAVYPIVSFGQGELTINGGTFRAGMYLYSLIADGQLVDTKQMILTK